MAQWPPPTPPPPPGLLLLGLLLRPLIAEWRPAPSTRVGEMVVVTVVLLLVVIKVLISLVKAAVAVYNI